MDNKLFQVADRVRFSKEFYGVSDSTYSIGNVVYVLGDSVDSQQVVVYFENTNELDVFLHFELELAN